MTATKAGIVAMLEWVWLGLRGWSSVPYVIGNYVLAEAVFVPGTAGSRGTDPAIDRG